MSFTNRDVSISRTQIALYEIFQRIRALRFATILSRHGIRIGYVWVLNL